MLHGASGFSGPGRTLKENQVMLKRSLLSVLIAMVAIGSSQVDLAEASSHSSQLDPVDSTRSGQTLNFPDDIDSFPVTSPDVAV